MNLEWQRYVQQLNEHLNYQYKQINEMNKTLQQLIYEVNQLKEKINQPTVIRNEYKFDLLKVERLSGTLNIGIKPDGTDASIGEFDVEQSMDLRSADKEYPELFDSIQQKISEYLDGDAYKTLKACENKYNYTLDDPHRKFIVEDVKKQIDGRIRYYLNQNKPEHVSPEQFTQIEQMVLEIVKGDIERTFETFIKNLPYEREKA
jgi:spore germination protein PC